MGLKAQKPESKWDPKYEDHTVDFKQRHVASSGEHTQKKVLQIQRASKLLAVHTSTAPLREQ